MNELEEELIVLFGRGVDAPLPEAEFNRLALAVFAYQFERNRPYGAYCRLRGKTPETVSAWEAIPALPTAAFKEAELTTVSPEEVRVVYVTSGTTHGAERHGRHLLPDTRLYDASLLPNFQPHLLPDRASLRFLVCGPTSRFFPHSSLGHMNSRVLEAFGAPGSGVFWRDDGPRFGCLAAALEKAEREGAPVCLLGTAFGFVHFLDWLAEQGRSFSLPPGSRLMDTGGYKGRSREVPKEELYRLYETRLGIAPTHLVNEYGMTELGSQFYDRRLRDHWAQGSGFRVQGSGEALGLSAAGDGQSEPSTISHQPSTPHTHTPTHPHTKLPPPWVRVQVVDPETLAPLPDGQPGLLRFFDLANLHSVLAIQTDDLGIWHARGFEVLGRARGAEPRGCSLAVEDLRAVNPGA